MKNIKKIIALVLALALTFAVAACGASDSGKKTIGIIQFGSHGSLNNCYDGIMQGLEENGITVLEGRDLQLEKAVEVLLQGE